MPNSKIYFGKIKIRDIKFGKDDVKLFYGKHKNYPTSVPIDDAVVTCASAIYNGNNQVASDIVVVFSGITLVEGVDYTVTKNNGGTNIGTYEVEVTGTGDNFEGTASGTFTINKVTPTVTAPTIVTGLVYNATSQTLVNAGSTNWGTLKYSLDNVNYSTAIPSGTNATSYTIYYRVDGDSNINDVAASSVSNSIAKVTPTVTAPTAKSLTYNGSAQALVNAGSTNWGTLKYSLDNVNYSTAIPSGTNATSYTVYYRVDGDSNINSVAANTVGVSIAKADTTYTAPTAKSLTYNGSAQTLLNAGAVTGGTMQYSSNNSTWGTEIPSGTNANSYTSYWRIVGDSNHNDKASVSISTTISAKTVSSPTITLSQDSYVYSNTAYQPTPTVKDGSTTISSSEYTVSYSNNINAGTGATCTITDKTGGNYIVSGSKTFTITKVTPTVTAPTPKTLTFNNSNQVLANAGSTDWGTMQYCLNNSGGTYTATVPSASAANTTYKVWYKVVGNSNINDVAPASIDCMIAEKRVTTPTIVLDPSSYTYNGSACQPTVTVKDGTTVIPAAEYTKTFSNNTNAGTATVTITDNALGNYYISGTTTFTINKANGSVSTAPTAKSLTYNNTAQQLINAGSGTGTMLYKLDSGAWGTAIPTATNATSYTVYYKASASTNYNESASGSVGVTISAVTPTVTAPKACGLTYNGSAQNLVSGGSTNYGTLVYSTAQTGTYTTTIPQGTNATAYTVWYKVSGNTNINSTTPVSVAVTIAKANTTYTAPTANNRTYDTTSKALLNAGAVTGGTIQYSSNNSTWSTTIPSQTNAGTYTTYWKIVGDSNHNDKASASISTTVSAKPVTPTVTLSQTSYTYSNSACQPTPTVKDGTVTIANTEYTVSYSNNTNVGTGATCTITDKTGGNYTITKTNKTFTINCYSATAPTAKNPNWSGSAQALVNAGSTSYGTIVYSTTSTGTFTTTIPTGTNAGNYEVWWKVTGNTNVCNTAATKVACTIKQVAMTYTAPKAAVRNWTGAAQQIVSGQTANGGSIYYATSSAGASSSTTIPTQSNAGTYSTYWKAVPDANHSGGTSTWAQITNCKINQVAMTYTAPKATTYTYDGGAKALLSGGSATGGSIQYSPNNSSWSTTIPSQTNAGTYTSYWKTVPDANHSGGTNSASISTTINKQTLSNVTITFNTSSFTYNRGVQKPSTVTVKSGTSTLTVNTHYTLSYSNSNSTNAGTYTISASPTSNYSFTTVSANYTIGKATPVLSTSPSYVSNWTYDASAHNLLSGGAMKHSSSDATAVAGTFTYDQGTNVGTYSNKKWYFAPTDTTNYNSTSGTVNGSVTCNCKACTAPTAKSLTYNGGNQALVNAGSTSYGTMVYSTNNSTWSTAIPSGNSAGSYTVYWKVTGNTNVCCTASSSVACSIAKAAMTYTAPKATTYAYGNTARALLSGGTATGGSIQYSTAQSGTYSTTVPTQTNAGTYTSWWKAVPDSNHSGGTNAASISTTISKANQAAPTAYGATATYPGTATATASGGGGQGSLEWSNGNSRSAAGSQTTQARWSGNSNYNASPWSNEVTLKVATMHNGHEYIEIGGVKWATMNIGATTETGYGQYFQWGDTTGYLSGNVGTQSTAYKKPFNWSDYKFNNGTGVQAVSAMTYYSPSATRSVLFLYDDAAQLNWGGDWSMPRNSHYQSLSTATTSAWTSSYNGSGVAGVVLTDKTDSSKKLFFPAAGIASAGSMSSVGTMGAYWQRSIDTSNRLKAYAFNFYNGYAGFNDTSNRCGGYSVRGIVLPD